MVFRILYRPPFSKNGLVLSVQSGAIFAFLLSHSQLTLLSFFFLSLVGQRFGKRNLTMEDRKSGEEVTGNMSQELVVDSDELMYLDNRTAADEPRPDALVLKTAAGSDEDDRLKKKRRGEGGQLHCVRVPGERERLANRELDDQIQSSTEKLKGLSETFTDKAEIFIASLKDLKNEIDCRKRFGSLEVATLCSKALYSGSSDELNLEALFLSQSYTELRIPPSLAHKHKKSRTCDELSPIRVADNEDVIETELTMAKAIESDEVGDQKGDVDELRALKLKCRDFERLNEERKMENLLIKAEMEAMQRQIEQPIKAMKRQIELQMSKEKLKSSDLKRLNEEMKMEIQSMKAEMEAMKRKCEQLLNKEKLKSSGLGRLKEELKMEIQSIKAEMDAMKRQIETLSKDKTTVFEAHDAAKY